MFRFCILILFFSNFAWSVSSTSARVVDRIKIDGDDGNYYFLLTTEKWGVPECADATYVYIVPSQVMDKEAMLSVVLASKMSGSKVWFTGTCDSSGGYFRATEVWME